MEGVRNDYRQDSPSFLCGDTRALLSTLVTSASRVRAWIETFTAQVVMLQVFTLQLWRGLTVIEMQIHLFWLAVHAPVRQLWCN